ncbi:uncharacterized protein BO95DRAFT_60733 [Aspergillus brunneoviolaceus CBS 621.78]|uniref:Uncharacterized protein n=1 Tax=Aspergillus brunneoviolaceus CBS 621.78 TaxID=1450534 RepID=A0ACD1GGM6_9EURO|nr:hypothetical protein BO95DRAFT_60733 [Aspergillus brunneoviolaceus CBS 621.78]RAH48241.1 hypothetical protein BO95DRAFT_60733 [Aspergillus brunneoviolaceus CBS 621.78]
MMRSGLQKPGAIPFLALLIFSLLSLVPSLAKEWDYLLPFGHIGYLRSEPRYVSRDKAGLVDARPRLRMVGGQPRPWSLEEDRSTYLDRKSRPRRPLTDAPPRSSFEAAAILDSDPVTYTVQESSAFRRGVRAFKALVTRQTDDPQAVPSFPSDSDAPVTDQTSPRLGPHHANTSVHLTPPHNEDFHLLASGNEGGGRTMLDTTKLVELPSWFLSCVLTSWQQACRVGNDYIETVIGRQGLRNTAATTSSNCSEVMNSDGSPQPWDPRNESHTKHAVPPALATDETQRQAFAQKPSALTQTIDASVQATTPPTATLTATEQSKVVEHQAEPERVRSGSCMAIVLAIVAGVMWF